MSLFEIQETLPYAAANQMLFDLFHEGRCTIKGHVILLSNPCLPKFTKLQDCLLWVFEHPITADTPGPNSDVSDIRQYRDRVEMTLWPWAHVRIDFV